MISEMKPVITKSLEIINLISPSTDINEFIEQNKGDTTDIPDAVVQCNETPILVDAIRQYKPQFQHLDSSELTPVASPVQRPLAAEEIGVTDLDLTSSAPSEDIDRDADISRFKLPESEHVIRSYSCALFQKNFPCHGRMYLTPNYLCFSGWGDAHAVVPYLQIKVIEKKHSARVFPNAIELDTMDQGILFFGSFLYREDCFKNLIQLWQIRKQMVQLMSNGSCLPPSPSSADGIIKEYEQICDVEIELSVADILAICWTNKDVYEKFLRDIGETAIVVADWEHKDQEYTAVCTPDSFQATRTVA